jgi:pimeloyl-ACP methyl ester carboxylesterase
MHWQALFAAAIGSVLSAAVTAPLNCTGIQAVNPRCATKQSAYYRDVFFIGGEYVPSGTSSIFSDQIYVEKLVPLSGVLKPHPVVFISAGVPSGTVWLNTPDNRKGWASYFIDKGYLVYIVDITANGRSSQNDVVKYPSRLGSTVSIHENDFTAPELIDPYPQSQGHNKWPGNGTQGDPIFDAFFAATLPLTSNATAQELSMRASGCRLLSIIGQSYLIAHSAGATYSSLMSDECPDQIRATINLEPGNLPFQNLVGNATVPAVGRSITRPWGLTNTRITYDPPVSNVTTDLITVEVGQDTPGNRSCFLQATTNSSNIVRTLPQIAKVPYVMFTAANSPHITYDHCFISYLNQTGVKDVTWIKFGDLGITGNGHFFYLETNNLDLAAVVEKEIARRN